MSKIELIIYPPTPSSRCISYLRKWLHDSPSCSSPRPELSPIFYPIFSHFTLRGPNNKSSQLFVFVAIYSATITVPITTVSHLGSCSSLPNGIATSSLYSNSLSILQSLPKANWIMLVSSLLLIHGRSQFSRMAYRAPASTPPNSSTRPRSTLYSVAWTSWISLRIWKTQSFFWPLSFYTRCSFKSTLYFPPTHFNSSD